MEWRQRLDLYFKLARGAAIIEFKFYVLRKYPDGKKEKKGGPSAANENEFILCIEKLLSNKDIIHRFANLVYFDRHDAKPSFHESYRDIPKKIGEQFPGAEFEHQMLLPSQIDSGRLYCHLLSFPITG